MKGIAIVTKFLGPTNFRGARIKATIPSGKSVTLHWDHALDSSENHLRAAAKAYEKLILSTWKDSVWQASVAAELAPWVQMTLEAYGVKGYVHIVHHCPKDQEVKKAFPIPMIPL